MPPIVTFLTDFGLRDHYVAVMKAVALRSGDLRLVDLGHAVPPQDVARASFLLAEAAPWFPMGTVHVAVVDPGVGTERRALVAEVDGQVVVAPDNGLVSGLWRGGTRRRAWLLDPASRREGRGRTFDGRDLFAPVGGALAAGRLGPQDCGPSIDPILLPWEPPTLGEGRASGRVQSVDAFGNLITDLRELPCAGPAVEIGGVALPWVGAYAEARPGALVALEGSSGWIEVARVDGSAAAALGVGVGERVTASW